MGGLECRPEANLPVVQKINHLAIRLGGETPDGVFDGGQVTIDLNSDAARRLEQYIGFNAGTGAQATLLAQHWKDVRDFVSALQGGSGTTVTQASLSVLQASPDIEGDTDDAARLRAGVLLESAAILLRIFGQGNVCAPTILVNGTFPRFAANPAQIRSERNSITTVASLYVRMGGEEDDGGLPDGTLSAAVTLSDVELREIDHLVGYRPPTEPVSDDDEPAGSELQSNWRQVRAMIVALRNPTGVIDSTALDAIEDRPSRERAAVQIQTIAGILRVMHSEAWRAGRAYGTSAAPTVLAAANVNAGSPFSLAAPTGGWRAGDQIFVDNNALQGVTVPANGTAALEIPANVLSPGEHTVEIRRTGGEIVRTPLTVAPAGPRVVAVTPADAGTNAPAVNNDNQGGSDWHLPSWLAPVLGGLGLGTVATYLLMRNRRTGGTPPPAGGNPPRGNNNPPRTDNNPPRQDGEGTRTDRRSSNPPPPPAARVAAANPQAAPGTDVQFLDEIDSALSEAKGSQSPGIARVAGGSPAALVTPENVIIKGATAEPVSGVTEDVIRSQIVLQYREFLSQGAREALQDNGTLPTGNELVNSHYAREVQELTDLVVSDYHKRFTSEEGRRALADLWENQHSERGYIVRRGVPSNVLREVVGRYIAEHSSNSGSPFAGGVGAQLRADAERHAGETEFFERSMPRVLRSIGR